MRGWFISTYTRDDGRLEFSRHPPGVSIFSLVVLHQSFLLSPLIIVNFYFNILIGSNRFARGSGTGVHSWDLDYPVFLQIS